MDFIEVLDQVIDLLRQRGRLTYRTIKLQFNLDDEHLDVLKDELIKGQRLAADEDGEVLVWAEGTAVIPTSVPASNVSSDKDQEPSPITYTPQYLTEKILTSRSALEGERKQVTVMFADIKDSTEMIRDLDPEAAQQLLDPAIHIMMDAVHRFEGTVNQVLGDGIMAIFGAPIAHEDHAARACYTALAMQAAMQPYADEVLHTYGVAMRIRVGLNSGEVVVRTIGNDLHMDYSAVGQTTNLASRMEQLAAPGSITLSATTLRLAEGLVRVNALGPIPVKGISEPVDIFELTGASGARGRLQAALARGFTHFVGRQRELDTLAQALQHASVGHGQVVAVIGEAGIGKSRLAYEFTHSYRTEEWLILESGAVSYGKVTPYLLIVDLLKGYFQINDRDSIQRRQEQVTGKILTLDDQLKDIIPPLLSLLAALGEDDPFWDLGARHRQSYVLESLKRLLLRESQRQPLLLVIEDLHWIDNESQTVLDTIVERLPMSRLLMLVNYRPEFDDRWTTRTYYTRLRIDPLPAQDADALLASLLGRHLSLQRLKALLKKRTGCNPFFLEEAVRTLVETNALVGQAGDYRLDHAIHSLQIPATVQSLLAARIDRLPAAGKQLLQSAAVIGEDVPLFLLQEITELSQDALQRGLTHLQAAEFLYETRLFPDPEYTFKHALTHEVAYESLLHERRRHLHRRVGEAIEIHYADRLYEYFEMLANQFERGEDWAKAVYYYLQAVEKVKEQYAYQSAVGFCNRAIELTGNDRGLNEERVQGLILLGDLLSLLGDVEQANQSYEQALQGVTGTTEQRHIANKRHQQHRVVRNGAKIAFYEHGSGDTTLVFAHPVTYGLATFQPIVEQLCQEFRLITIDPLGTGASDSLAGPYTLKEHAEDVRAVIEASWSGPIVAVGVSRGGTLMLTLAATYPSLVQKLLLMSSHAAPSVTYSQLAWPVEARDLLKQGQKEQALRLIVAAAISEPGTGHLTEQFVQSRMTASTDLILDFITPNPEDDVDDLLPYIQVPTLVMHGTDDRFVPFEMGRYLVDHIANAQFYPLQGRGHGYNTIHTATNEFCQVLRCFIQTGRAPQTRDATP